MEIEIVLIEQDGKMCQFQTALCSTGHLLFNHCVIFLIRNNMLIDEYVQ